MSKRCITLLLLLALLVPWMPVRAEAGTIKYSGTCGSNAGWYIDDDYNLFIYGTGAVDTTQPFKSYKTNIVSVTVQEGITSFASTYLFDGFTNCVSFSFPSTLTEITGTYCFGDLTLSSIIIPDSVTKLGTYCFGSCTNLSSFTFPASITSVGQRAFSGCSSLTDLYFVSATPPSFSSNALEGCPTDLKIHVPAGYYDAYCQAIPAYSAFIVDDSPDYGGGMVQDGPNYYFLTVSHENKDAFYWGSTCQFYANFSSGWDSADINDRSVTWSVLSATDSQTNIDSSGFLTIGPHETSTWLNIKAASVLYPDLYSTSSIRVIQCAEGDTDSGSSDGSGSGVDYSEEFISLGDDISNVQISVDSVADAVDGVSDQLDSVGDAVEESNGLLGDIVNGITSLPETIMEGIKGLFVPDAEAMAAQQDKWTQLLADRFGAVYESGTLLHNFANGFQEQSAQSTIQFPSVTIPLGQADWVFGGWTVDVVPDGFEAIFEVLKKIIDILCTFTFVNAMKNRFDRTLEDRG